MKLIAVRPGALLVLAAALAVGVMVSARSSAVQAAGLSVEVNGSPVSFSPAPIERAGRVFVPLRGVFERLGASVVYQSGTINATSGTRTIALRIGSTSATVNGQPQALDVAPFIVGASTFVPLRFVSQALGASVNYDGANRIVAITTNGQVPAAPAAPAQSVVQLKGEEPAAGAVVAAKQPTISADFTAHVDPNSVRVTLDGLDVTSAATRSETGIIYAPPSPLQATKHTVRVTGKEPSGQSFDRSWSFTSGTETPKNFIKITAPAANSSVGGTFTVSGKTLPNARVHIVAGSIANLGGVFSLGTGNYSGDLTADQSGSFSQEVTLTVISGGAIGLTVTSTDPVTKGAAERKLRLSVK
ncbi:MAG: stalk domain-containing protein [Vulcanimicrobiaceae bacterium]